MASRLILVAVIAILSVAMWAPDIVRPFGHPLGRAGFAVGPDGRIAAVDPGSPAEQAGLKPGQRIDWRGTPLESRIILVDSASNAVQPVQRFPVRVQTEHGALLAVVTAEPEAGTDFSTALPRDMFALLLTLAGIALVLIRPGKVSWAFLIFVLFGRGAPVNELMWVGPPTYRIAATILLEPLASAASTVALIVFALYLMVDPPIARWRRAAEGAAYGVGAAIALLSTWSTISAILYGVPIAAANIASIALGLGAEIAVPVLLCITYSSSGPAIRSRLRWPLAGLSVNSAIASVIDFTSQGLAAFTTMPYWLYPALSGIDSVVLLVTVLYAMLPYRTGALAQ
jgi:hypothetical protein